MFNKKKKIILHIIAVLPIFAAGFLTRGLFDRQRVSGTDEHYKNIQNELGRADESYNKLEKHIENARSGITAGVERFGIIRSGITTSIEHSGIITDRLDGIEGFAVENTDLLTRAERILLEAGAREQKPQE